MSELRTGFEPGGVIASESEQKRFIRLFGAILRLRNILTSFDDFADADVLDDGDHEIPADITRALASSPSLRNKRGLIEDFVRSVSSTGDVAAQWEAHITDRQQAELDALISEERLKAEPTRRLVAAALEGLARIGVEGTAVSRILPPMSRFRRTAGSDTLDTKKHRVADELAYHVDRFSGLLGVSPEIHVAE